MKNPHILVLNWRDITHPLAGGAEMSLHEHAKQWILEGARVTWVSSSYKNAKKTEILEDINYIRIGSHYTVHILFFLTNLLKPIKADIIIDCFHFIPFFSPIYFRIPVIALINEPAKNAWFKNIIFPFSLLGYLIEPLFFLPYKRNKFITSAESIKMELVKNYNIKPQNISLIQHGVTIKSSNEKKNDIPTILYASRLSPDKGIEEAIKAMAILSKQMKNFEFWIIGKAEREDYLHKVLDLVDYSGLKSKTQYFGFVTQEKKFELMKKAWILVHPSLREGWGLNVIEANAMGTPAVGFDVTGLRDSIRNGETGILTRKNTPEGIEEEVLNLIADTSFREKLSKNAIVWSRKFLWDESGNKSFKLIQKVLDNE